MEAMYDFSWLCEFISMIQIFFFEMEREAQESDDDMVIYGELPTYIGKVGDDSVSFACLCVREKVE